MLNFRNYGAQDGLPQTQAVALHQDRLGFLWVGTYGGLSRYDGRTFETLTSRDGLSVNRITDIVETDDGTLVAGTFGGGVCFVANRVVVGCLREVDGLAGDVVNALFADSDGSIWVATTKGLTELRDRRPVHTFRAADGLPSDDVQKVWGLHRVGVLTRAGAAELVGDRAEGPSVGGRRYPRIDAELPPRPGVVTMHFASPTFRDERAVRFRYRLNGRGAAWSEAVSEPTVSLAGLGPGSYMFEVEAVSHTGVESPAPAQVRFTVLPTFWQTGWFMGLTLLLAASALAGVPFLRARRLERERKRLEALVHEHTRELAIREERMRAILEHSTNLFYAHTTDHRLTYVSPQSWHFFDCSPEDALKNWTDFLTDAPGNADGFEATERAIRTGERQPAYELELQTARGRRIRVLVNEAPVVVGGKTVSIVGSLTDITEAREAEERRRRLEEQFLQAQRMEAVGRLAGGVAHDFNNLLTSIMGHAQLISETAPADAELREDLAQIERAAKRGSALVSQLLGFSRRQIRRDERIDAREVLADLRELLVRLTTGRIELEMRHADEPLFVSFDRSQLGQAIANLVINAVDAMKHGGHLTVAVESVTLRRALAQAGPDEVPAGRYVGIEVADTGSGMARSVLEHVFEPFYTTKEPGTASGLGLSMVYGAVRQGGGYVTAASTPDVGTVVHILLPPAV